MLKVKALILEGALCCRMYRGKVCAGKYRRGHEVATYVYHVM